MEAVSHSLLEGFLLLSVCTVNIGKGAVLYALLLR